MDETAITRAITEAFAGTDVVVASQESGAPEVAWGDSFFYYNPDRSPDADRRFPFATIVTKDYGDFDSASNLDRPGIFRLNVGIGRETYRALFSDGEDDEDFAALDRLLPHPIYGRQYWVCVLNPSAATFQTVVRPLLAEAYELAAARHAKQAARE